MGFVSVNMLMRAWYQKTCATDFKACIFKIKNKPDFGQNRQFKFLAHYSDSSNWVFTMMCKYIRLSRM